MNVLDQNFETVVRLLDKENIFYWIGQGSLLGIIRDNKLIEWDHDIDFCVWHDSNNKDRVVKLLQSAGFDYRKDLEINGGNEQMSFDRNGGRRVDINFYQKGKTREGEKIAFVKWSMPRNIFMQLLDAISLSDIYDSKYKNLIRRLSILKPTATYLKNFLIEKNFFYKNVGYQQPLELLKEFKIVNFHNLNINIPTLSEEYLKYLYGDNWRVPQKKFSWWKVKNLKKYYD